MSEEEERDGTVGAMSEEEEKEEAEEEKEEAELIGAMREEEEAEQTVGAMKEDQLREEEAEQRPGLSSGTVGATSCEEEEAEQETELSEGVRVPGAEVFPREPVPVPPSKPGTRGTRPAGGDEAGAPRPWAPDLKHESSDRERESERETPYLGNREHDPDLFGRWASFYGPRSPGPGGSCSRSDSVCC